MIIGYTCGVYDILHIGHINLLKNAKSMCDKLIVGLSTDECVKYKFKNTIMNYDTRKTILESIKYVDMVLPQEDTDKVKAYKKIKYNKLFVGDDWYGTEKWNNFEKQLREFDVDVIYFPYTKSCSTTILKKNSINLKNCFFIFDLDKTLWNFYTNLLSEEEFLEKLKNYKFSDDIIRIFKYLDINNIKYGFASRSKYINRCKLLLEKININLDEHYYHIEYTKEKTKLKHINEIVLKSSYSPEYFILFDDDQENLDSVKNKINLTKLVDKEKNITFEDFLNILYKL